MEHTPHPPDEHNPRQQTNGPADANVALPEGRAGPLNDETASEQQRRGGPRIYAASLADYNAGELHGTWIDADQDPDDLADAVAEMLGASPTGGAEEWAIHDYEGFGALHLSEYETLDTISRLGAGIAAYGAAFACWAAYVGTDPDELGRFDETYLGHFDSAADYAEQLLEDMGIDPDAVGPDWLAPYIRVDVDALARDLAYELHIADDPTSGVHLFQP